MLQIGEVAKQSGIGVETVRYYEREGLIPLPDRSPSGYRRYPKSVIGRVKFIQQAKTLGFSLKEIAELIALKHTPDSSCNVVKTKAVKKLADIQEKINTLEAMKSALEPLIDQCQQARPLQECPILNAIEEAP